MNKKLLILSLVFSFFIIAMQADVLKSGFEKYGFIGLLKYRAYSGLVWNLLLAWVAVGMGFLVVRIRYLFFFWMLWLPNTLYMVTDLKYIGHNNQAINLAHLSFFLLYGVTGVFTYLAAINPIWAKWRYRKDVFIGLTIISIIGVIVGRVLRWNSWEIFTKPKELLSDIISLF